MKHLKPFNESKENFVEELKDFCETNLAYLLDEGGKVEVHTFESDTLLQINITNSTWSNIKDHMIPFLTRLKNNYQIEERPSSGFKYGVQLKAAIWDYPGKKFYNDSRTGPPPLHFANFPFKMEDLIEDNNPYSIKVRHFDQVHLEDLAISDFQFFIKNK
jgi:hypothetical protein